MQTIGGISTGPRFAVALALSVGIWAMQVWTYSLTARAAHFNLPLVGTVAAILAVNLGFAVRATPGNVGVFQAMYARDRRRIRDGPGSGDRRRLSDPDAADHSGHADRRCAGARVHLQAKESRAGGRRGIEPAIPTGIRGGRSGWPTTKSTGISTCEHEEIGAVGATE